MTSPRRRGKLLKIWMSNSLCFIFLVFQGRDAVCPAGYEEEVNLYFVSLLQLKIKGLIRKDHCLISFFLTDRKFRFNVVIWQTQSGLTA